MAEMNNFKDSSLIASGFRKFEQTDMGITLRSMMPPRKRGLVARPGYHASEVFYRRPPVRRDGNREGGAA
jgi:hypothetical protein